MLPFPKVPNIVPGLVNTLTGHGKKRRIKGTAMVMKKNMLDFNDVPSTVFDNTLELFGQGVTLQLISSVHTEHTLHGVQGKRGKPANLKNWIIKGTPIAAGVAKFKVTFDHEEDIGIPEAFSIRNNHRSEFFLKDFMLEDVPGADRIHFVCNSWVYPASKCKNDRVFFANKTYLPSETPVALRKYRERELVDLRGDGKGELKEGDRVYDYAYYNDLGDPDNGPQYARPILGGSSQYPYPRRGRTGRPRTRTDPKSESKQMILKNTNIYVPSDERFGHLKMSDFLAYGLKSIAQSLRPALVGLFDNEFNSFQDVLNLYEGGFPLPKDVINQIANNIPFQMMKEIFRTDAENMLRFPVPQVIKEVKSAWRTDEEFGREMLAGVNPVIIRRLQKFPPQSNLDPKIYGNHTSTITEQHIEKNLDGRTVDEAIKSNKLFILDHHDHFMPYLRRINDETEKRIYGTRTLLFLKEDGTLKPVAIELSLPYPDESDDQFGCFSKVYTPAEGGVESSIWQLAKAYAAVNDCGFHQIISHWLNTHAVIEPFVIATNRQLSVLHPIHKLLYPHFRDTMNINAQARQFLVNANGLMEITFFPGKYAMELSSAVYKNWVFPDQALPADLIKRGVAVKDANSPHGLRLLIEDYPYAVDGLQIWFAIRTWVKDYCSFYYKTDDMIQKDTELQSWWKELVEKGHGDKKRELWWPKMQTIEELIESCTIIIWTASALHAAVNFGQYPFAAYIPNRPTVSRRFMPEEGTPEYEELKTNPDLAFLKTITSKNQSIIGLSLVEILSRHSSDEIYLGQRDSNEWTADAEVLEAFKKFGVKLTEIEHGIMGMNNDKKLKNRAGPVKLPYTLLYPTGEPGLSGKGIPNSISI